MTYKQLIEENFTYIKRKFGDSWEYDALMELYLNKGEQYTFKDSTKTVNQALINKIAQRHSTYIKAFDIKRVYHLKGKKEDITDVKLDSLISEDLKTPFFEPTFINEFFIEWKEINKFLSKDTLDSKILKMYYQGYTCREIGLKINKSKAMVSWHLVRAKKEFSKLISWK
tara:strand:- start:16992 stop:17501 length:510 start_codon:yes stop_codon:yes gene_type:complete